MEGSSRARLGRRALLAAGAAGVAAAAVQAVAPASVLAGGDHEPVIQGEINVGRLTTVVATNGNHALQGRSDVGDGLRGETNGATNSGVYGYSNHIDGYGVFGRNVGGDTSGFLGGKDQGVRGNGHAAEGVRGESGTNYGVVGLTQSPANKAGVIGYSLNANGCGVRGTNEATGTVGELGFGGMALYGKAPVDVNHLALFVNGRAEFSTSGILTIPKRRSSVSVAMPALNPWSMVLATLQTSSAGVYIQAAVAKLAEGKITVYLNKTATVATKVAYLVLQTE
jgi:hypothetical protein